MANVLSIPRKTGKTELEQLFNEARIDERRTCAFSVSIRMESLAIHILREGMNGVEAEELLRREVARYEAESRGDWH
ncbi:DUF2732 domain-containing protein [Enterobacter hormaechei]|nr:DUF2732 domain-containing protein [Enterobacter hormaechei]